MEGYNNWLNSKYGDHPPTYRLIETLYAEAIFVTVTAKLITSHGVQIHSSKKSKAVQMKIWKLWDDYDQGTVDKREFLTLVSNFVAFQLSADEAD